MQPFRYLRGFTASLETHPDAHLGTFISWQGPVTAKEDPAHEECAGVRVHVQRFNTPRDEAPSHPCDRLLVMVKDILDVRASPQLFITSLINPSNHFLVAKGESRSAVADLEHWLYNAYRAGLIKNSGF